RGDELGEVVGEDQPVAVEIRARAEAGELQLEEEAGDELGEIIGEYELIAVEVGAAGGLLDGESDDGLPADSAVARRELLPDHFAVEERAAGESRRAAHSEGVGAGRERRGEREAIAAQSGAGR